MYLRYVCKECEGIVLIDNFWKWLSTLHFGAKKYLRCPHCYAKRHYMARLDGRKHIDAPWEKNIEKDI